MRPRQPNTNKDKLAAAKRCIALGVDTEHISAINERASYKVLRAIVNGRNILPTALVAYLVIVFHKATCRK